MKSMIKRYEDAILAAIVAIEVVVTAITVDAAIKSGAIDEIRDGHVKAALTDIGWNGIFPAILVVALLAHFQVIRTARVRERDDESNIIEHLLEVTARAVAFPKSLEKVPVRVYCWKLDARGKSLVHYASVSGHKRRDDRWKRIPLDDLDDRGHHIFVIAEAAATNRAAYRSLAGTRSGMEETLHVPGDLRSVLAVPVHAADDSEGRCLGIISIDTSEGAQSLLEKKDDQERAIDILECLGQAIGQLWS